MNPLGRYKLPLLAALAARSIEFSDLPPALRQQFQGDTFRAEIEAIERSTAQRLREGEREHLVYYVLQSTRFTSQAPLEPALSAKAFMESGGLPAAVGRRMDDFLGAPAGPSSDERLRYFRQVEHDRAGLEEAYRSAMRFLYDKEFLHRDRVYETRGHSSDTEVAAAYAVWTGLGVLRSPRPAADIREVLLVGPGLDFAPRTGFRESAPPQSYQPFALADALGGRAHILCVDINPRVLAYFERRPRRLEIFSLPGDAEYNRWLDRLGSNIGARSGAAIAVRADVARRITAQRLNIVTQRLPARFDLIVATNVLLYFSDRELALALANIAAMLRPGGYFLHNDLRSQTESYAQAAGLRLLQARSVRIADRLYDTISIHGSRL